jgi:hypothetical protein
LQWLRIDLLVVKFAVFPTAKDNPGPRVSQRADRGWMGSRWAARRAAAKKAPAGAGKAAAKKAAKKAPVKKAVKKIPVKKAAKAPEASGTVDQ